MPLHSNLLFNDCLLVYFGLFFHFNLIVSDILHLELLDFANIVDFVVLLCLYLFVKDGVFDLSVPHLIN